MARTAAIAEKTEKKQATNTAVLEIRKKFGEGAIFRLGDGEKLNIERIKTNIVGLDANLAGGFPKGRIMEIYGEESCYKSSLALHVAAEVQKNGQDAAIIDLEYAFNADWARTIGVDTDKLFVSQPDNGNMALEIVELLLKNDTFGCIIVDSVAALVPQQELDGDFGDANVGLQARLMGQACRKLVALVSNSNCCLIFINQLRSLVGVMFGPEKTTTGGKALKFYSSVRVEMSKVGQIKDGEEVIGYTYKTNITKNKTCPPLKKYNFDVYFDEAFSKSAELLNLGIEHKFIEKSGAWYSYEGERWQGKEKAKIFLKENPNIANELETKIRGFLGLEVTNV